MKRFLVENAGTIHLILFVLWLLGAFICLIMGHNTPVYISLTAVIALSLQVVFAVAEADWTNDICEGCGYDNK